MATMSTPSSGFFIGRALCPYITEVVASFKWRVGDGKSIGALKEPRFMALPLAWAPATIDFSRLENLKVVIQLVEFGLDRTSRNFVWGHKRTAHSNLGGHMQA